MWDTGELKRLAADFEVAELRMGAEAAKVVRAAAQSAQATAQRLAPVDTGELRASVEGEVRGDGRFASMTARVRAGTDHAFFQEFGTSRMPPRPFMGPTLDIEGPEFQAKLAAILGRIL